MVAKKLSHVVKRPGQSRGDPSIDIRVAEELVSQPGVPDIQTDVDFYSRRYPLDDPNFAFTADNDWSWENTPETDRVALRRNYRLISPLVKAARVSGDLGPSARPKKAKDVTEEIRIKARELGFGEVGITRYDRRYSYQARKRWVKYEHAICLVREQDYERTQATPSTYAEDAAFHAYAAMSQMGLILADYIRGLGYHAQVHSPLDPSGVYIPMFVASGLGQLGANGQLLSPNFGSRGRLMIITTDAIVTYDEPVDYGMHKFCQICQVCVNRCPGRALMREKIWWRGVEKNKLVYERCRPVMTRFSACGICMKVCPVQKYGMKVVMDYYVDTGKVLGKDTHELEGYVLKGKGYFGPGDLPHFDSGFFEIPHTTSEDALFREFKSRVREHGVPDGPAGDMVLQKFKKEVKKALARDAGEANPMAMILPAEELERE